MIIAENNRDEFYISKDRVTFTQEQLHIPGLRMMGHHMIHSVLKPLNWHYHENAFEFSLSVKGKFVFETLEKVYQFSGGDVFVSYPNEVHGTNRDPVASGELYWFQLDVSCEEDFLFLCPEAARELIAQMKAIPHHVIHGEISLMLPLMKNAFKAAFSGDDKYRIAAYIVLFLHMMLTYVQKNSAYISLNIQSVLEYIQENITSEIVLEELADIAQLSCSQFKNNFKKEVGISPRQYINQQKIEYAKKFLLEGKSITETAMILSFSSSDYFSSVFKKYTRFTPTEYVQEHIDNRSD